MIKNLGWYSHEALTVEDDPKVVNDNCLSGMRCPKCRSLGPFSIAVTTVAVVHDDGSDETGELNWDDSSRCGCRECPFVGVVKDFTIAEVGNEG